MRTVVRIVVRIVVQIIVRIVVQIGGFVGDGPTLLNIAIKM